MESTSRLEKFIQARLGMGFYVLECYFTRTDNGEPMLVLFILSHN